MKKEPNEPSKDRAAGKAEGTEEQTNNKLAKKMLERRIRWKWNRRLGLISGIIVVVVLILSTISYQYNSSAAATTFLDRADAAAEKQEYSDQSKWLRRYSLMKPDDREIIVRMALAADSAADSAPPEQRALAIYNARKQLGEAIARLGSKEPDTIRDLRTRLIKRLLQLDERWFSEVERQIIELQPEKEDPEAVRWLAQALMGQVTGGIYKERREVVSQDDYWHWLANQCVGDVLCLDVDLNGEDFESTARFLNAYQNESQIFVRSPGETKEEHNRRIQDRVERTLAQLKSRDDARSQLIVYRFENGRKREAEATKVLLAAARRASAKLAELDVPEKPEGAPPPIELPPYYWDYVILGEAATSVSESDPEQASKWYDQLTSLQLPDIPKSTAASIFVNAGMAQEIAGNREVAIEVWEKGLEEVDENNLDLLGSLAAVRIQDVSDEQADEVVKKFRDAIDLSRRALDKKTEREISPPQRAAITRMIDSSAWRLKRVEAILAVREGDTTQAIERLEEALTATAEVDARERVLVARQLSRMHGAEGAWDRAAAALDRAVNYAPNDMVLRAEAAQASMRAGNRLPAVEHWRVVGSSDSLPLKIRSAEALFNYEIRLDPDQRDFSAVRSAIRQLRKEIAELETPTNEAELNAVQRAAGRIDVLEASLPPSGTLAEDHLQSKELAEKARSLSEQHPKNDTIQAFAAVRMAVAGDQEGSQQALKRLEEIVGADGSPLAIVQAQIDAELGDPLKACRRLMAQAKKDSDASISLLQLAANFGQQADNAELAYEAISEIDPESLSLDMLYSLTVLAKQVPKDSPLLVVNGKGRTPDEMARYWEDEIRDKEGKDGSYWRFLNATRIIDEMKNDPNVIEHDDPRLEECKKLVREVLTQRPNWGEAISLNGWVSGIEGKHEQAVEQLQRGIAAGDRRLQTRFELWRHLNALKRYDEADKAIKLAAFATDTSLDKFAGVRVQLAQSQGDFSRSLKLAEAAVQEKPDDFMRHVLLCNTAVVAATNEKDEERRSELIEMAKSAIEKAVSLAESDVPEVFLARLGIVLFEGDEQAIRDEIDRIGQSKLPNHSQYLLQAKAVQGLKDGPRAMELLEKADSLRPTVQTKLLLARQYRELGRTEDEVKALREAKRLSPNDAQINNDLARAIVTRDGEKADWDELTRLLATGKRVTASNRLLYALLLSQQSKRDQKVQALRILRELYQERNSRSDDAARVLAVLLRNRIEESVDDRQTERWDNEVRSVYEYLVLRRKPLVTDIYRYADYLLDLGQEQDLSKVKELRKRLLSLEVKEGVMYSLDLSMRLAFKEGQLNAAPSIAQKWFEEVIVKGQLNEVEAASVAGAALLKAGHPDQAVDWFEKAYQQDPTALGQYIFALNKVGLVKKSIDVCFKHYTKHGNVEAVILLVEAVMNDREAANVPKHQQAIKQALADFGDNAALLEGVATLQMLNEDYAGAIKMFQEALMREPTRLRALNNLAMALSETPGREREGLKPINRAIALAGELPELLDTKGVVLMKSDRFVDAENVFEQAIRSSDEPRYQFHLVMALIAQEKTDQARKEWNSIDQDKLEPSGLTPAEQEQYTLLKKTYGS